jgi:hypothetical protein
MHIEFAVDLIHTPGIKENQCNKHVDRALLRKPEAQLKTTKTNVIELLDEDHAEAERTDKPDKKAGRDESEIGAPVCQSVFRMHKTPAKIPCSGKSAGHKKAASCEAAF